MLAIRTHCHVSCRVLAGWRWRRRTDTRLQVPGGLAFSEFRGYENWQVIAVAHNGDKLDAVFGNPTMIEAYKVRHSRERQAFP